MKVVPFEYCNECKLDTHLVVTGGTEDSIFATCPQCDAKFDLIYDEWRVKVANDKDIFHLRWYTRKVAELGAVHVARRTARHDRRAIRLVAYKHALNARLRRWRA